MKKFVIKPIRLQGEQLIVGIPKKSGFKPGDYVLIKEVNEEYCLGD